VSFSGVAVTALHDLFEHVVPTGKLTRLLGCRVSQVSDSGDAEAEHIEFKIERVIGSPTSGSGGTTFVPIPVDARQLDSTALTAWEVNNTTQNSGGTRQVLDVVAASVEIGYTYKGESLVFGAGHSLVISMSAPSDSLTLSGVCKFQVANENTAAF